MHVLSEPGGRHLNTNSLSSSLAVYKRAEGGELVAKPDIIDKAGHFLLRLTSGHQPCDEIRKSGNGLEVDLLSGLPPSSRRSFFNHHVSCRDMDRSGVSPMDHQPIGAPDRIRLDLRPLDRADMHARLDPLLEKNIINGIRRAHHDVGGANRMLRLLYGHDFNPEQRSHFATKIRAVLLVWAVAADDRNVAHGACGHELRPSLPSATEQTD